MSWYLPTVCLILSFKQNIMTFRLGCYLMHHLKGISQLLNIVYVKHTQKEKSINLYWTLPLQGTMMRTPFENYIYRKWHLFKDRRGKKTLIPVPWNGPIIGLWERFCETSASWSLLMRYLKIRNLVLKLYTQESTLLWVVIGGLN